MEPLVFSPRAYEQIIESIILFISVDVVDYFSPSKSTSQMVFDYDYVLGHVFVTATAFGRHNHDVAVPIYVFSALPAVMLFSSSVACSQRFLAGSTAVILDSLVCNP